MNSGLTDIENRTQLLTLLSTNTLGSIGTAFLSVLVALACFTTAVGIVTGTADFVKGVTQNSQGAYTATAVLGCVLGVVVGQFNVGYIIDIALPALMFIYPITIVLIVLNAIPKRFASKRVFRGVTLVTIVFSIPDFLQFFVSEGSLDGIQSVIPLSNVSLGWVLPAFLVLVGLNVFLNPASETV